MNPQVTDQADRPRRKLSDRLGTVSPTTPLRLSVAAELAFPDGSITASSLRTEASRGRLTVERIAGKYFTTLNDIEEMRNLCRVPQNPHASSSVDGPDGQPRSSSSTMDMKSAQALALKTSQALKQRSRVI